MTQITDTDKASLVKIMTGWEQLNEYQKGYLTGYVQRIAEQKEEKRPA